MEAEGDANSARESGDAHSGEFNAVHAVSALHLYFFFFCFVFFGGYNLPTFEVVAPGHMT